MFQMKYLTIILICVGVCSAGSMPAMGSALVGGVEFHENLLHGEVVCRSVPVPMFAESVLVEASVTGLRGNPNIFGGWEEREIVDMIASNLAPVNSGGYHIYSEFFSTVPPNRNSFFVCVTTFATQGSDYVLLASVSDATAWVSPSLGLLSGFPVTWRLEGRDYEDFILGDLRGGQVRISLTPLGGEVDLLVSSDCVSSNVLARAATDGPEYLLVDTGELTSVCIRVHTRDFAAEFVLLASTGLNDLMYLAQSIPITGQIGVSSFRAHFNTGTDTFLITRRAGAEKNVEFAVDTVENGDAWTSQNGRLEISKSALEGRVGGMLFIKLVVGESDDDSANSLFQMTLTSHNSVETLAEGIPIETTVEGENRFRDYRVWIPGGSKFTTVFADSCLDGSGLGIFVGQVRTSHDPRGYTWNTMTGSNELVLPVSDLSDCLDGCYLYISLKSCVVVSGQCSPMGASKFLLQANSDSGVAQLVESREIISFGSSLVFEQVGFGGVIRVFHIQADLRDVEISLSVDKVAGDFIPCAGQYRCTIVVDEDHSLFLQERIYIVVRSLVDVRVSVVFRRDFVAQYLRNHHEILGNLNVGNALDKFMFVLPPHVDSGLLDFRVDESITLTMCKFGQTDCQSITKSGVLHLNSAVAISVGDGSQFGKYTLIPSFFDSVNSLRVGYKPVQVSLDPGSKITWQVGYYEASEWLISASGAVGGEMCIEQSTFGWCCQIPCSLQEFGRQLVWVDGVDHVSLITISTEPLAVLAENEAVEIAQRKTRVFKLPTETRCLLQVDSGDTEFVAPAENGGWLAAENGPFVRVSESATTATLRVLHTLYANRWTRDFWVTGSNIRIETCGAGDLYVDGNLVDGFLDELSGELVISGSARYRVGSITGERIEFTNQGGRVQFEAPENAAGSTYRVVCGEASYVCELEEDPLAIYGLAGSCVAGTVCELELPNKDCPNLTIVADNGVEFGIFTPAAATLGTRSVFSTINFFYILVIFLFIKYLRENQILVRMLIYRWLNWARDFARGKAHDDSLEAATGYREMKDTNYHGRARSGEMYGLNRI